ncbi:MAG TPA: hypothetical protein VKA15_20245 [Isosphaeraceae bacterium]|nr:hypothetical protein [Isosphaeraceae bacterium]
MTKLIVTRLQHSAEGRREYRILIDGNQVGSIGPGQTVQFDLPPGHHELTARIGWCGSQRVGIEGGPDGAYHLTVGRDWRFQHLLRTIQLVIFLPLPVLTLFLSVDSQRLTFALGNGWFSTLIVPIAILPSVFGLARLAFWWDRTLCFQETRSQFLPDDQTPELPLKQPRCVRITIRGMMIAVAVVAVVLWAGIGWVQQGRRSHLRRQAELHASVEAIWRREEQAQNRQLADLLERRKQIAGLVRDAASNALLDLDRIAASARDSAAKHSARADYHDAMRRKYEHAIAERSFSVEPDPPPPRFP